MTGHELLAELNKLSSTQLNLEVETEGCDCCGDVDKVVVEYDDWRNPGNIVLHRGPETQGIG